MKKATGVWRSQDGRATPISDLADSHLNNIIPYLQRRIPILYPDWAQDTSILDKASYLIALDDKCRYTFGEWDNLVDEARRRELRCLASLPTKLELSAPKPDLSVSEPSTALVAASCLLIAGLLGLKKAQVGSKRLTVKSQSMAAVARI